MPDASHSPSRQLDVAIVGGGLAGVYAVHRLRSMGLKVRAYEAGSGVGAAVKHFSRTAKQFAPVKAA